MARWQYGQTWVVYIFTAGMSRSSGGFLDRQVGLAPGRQAAGQHDASSRSRACFSVAAARDWRAHRSRRPAPPAASCSWAGRSSSRRLPSGTFFAPTAWPAANSAGSLTSISTAFSRLISCTACAGVTRAAAAAARQHRPEQQATGDDGGEEQKPVVEKELHGSLQPLRRKARIIEFAPLHHRARPGISSSRTRPAHAQARPHPPRRIDLEPGEPLHRLDRRRASRPPAWPRPRRPAAC